MRHARIIHALNPLAVDIATTVPRLRFSTVTSIQDWVALASCVHLPDRGALAIVANPKLNYQNLEGGRMEESRRVSGYYV